MKILAICGSLQQQSSNLTLLQSAARLAPAGVEVVRFEGLADLPHFNPDLDAAAIASVAALRQAVSASDAVLIASPEYGHSLPGALKNGIDWLIGSGELERKIVAITAAVPARERGQRGLKALADTLAAVSATLVGGEPIPRGPTAEAELAALLQTIVKEVTNRADTRPE